MDLIEFLGVSTLARSTRPLSLGERGGSTNKRRPPLLVSGFEEGGELAAPVHLDGSQGKRQTALQGVQEQSGRRRSGTMMDLDHIPARDHVTSGELFQDHVGRRPQVHRIELHQIARRLHRVILGFTQRPGASRRASSPFHPKDPRSAQRSALGRDVRIRPTIETDTGQLSRRNSTANLSLPQRGNCSRRRRTCSACSAVQVDRRR